MGRFAIFAVLACLVGCGTEASDDASGGGPKGGNSFGTTLPELELWGYVRNDPTGLADDATLGPISFDSIRQSTDKTHMLLHVSGFT